MFSYGQLPTGGAMFVVAMLHSVTDGLTISSAGVAVGMVAPKERQAGAQGLLGGVQTLTGGTALTAGAIYEHARANDGLRRHRRPRWSPSWAPALYLAGSAWNLRGEPVDAVDAAVVDPVLP